MIVLNGVNSDFAGTISDLVADRRGIAVAINGRVVPRVEWSATECAEGDIVDVLTAVQGG